MNVGTKLWHSINNLAAHQQAHHFPMRPFAAETVETAYHVSAELADPIPNDEAITNGERYQSLHFLQQSCTK